MALPVIVLVAVPIVTGGLAVLEQVFASDRAHAEERTEDLRYRRSKVEYAQLKLWQNVQVRGRNHSVAIRPACQIP